MSKRAVKLISLLIVCLMIPAINLAQTESIKKAPNISLKDLKGKMVKLSKYKDKIILLNFWATWCLPCLAEVPELIKWQKEYQNQGLQIIGITYPPTNRRQVRKFVNRNKINYPILFGSKKTKELFDSGKTMPFSVVIDKNGNILDRIEGVIFDEEFDEKVKPLLNTL